MLKNFTCNGVVPILGIILFMPAVTRAATVITSLPYTITAPGKYELQRDLVASETSGITVNADNVAIDLKEHTISLPNITRRQVGVSINATNVTVRNGTISGFLIGVDIEGRGSQDKLEKLQVLNSYTGIALEVGNDHLVQDCYIIGRGKEKDDVGILVFAPTSGVQITNNQVSECGTAIRAFANGGSAIIHNYVANSQTGFELHHREFYQGNVATNCAEPYFGGIAIGTENGGD